MKMDTSERIFTVISNRTSVERYRSQDGSRSLRVSKNFGFIVLYDGTFFKTIQVVFEDNLENFKELSKISVGSSLTVRGTIVDSPGANQDFELKASSVEILNLADLDFPIQKKRHTLEFLRTIAHLRPRTNTFTAVFRIRSLLAFAIHQFFVEKGFVYIHTPIITGSDAEGAGEMFKVTTLDLMNIPLNEEKKIDYSKDFFGKEANLTVSGQLAVENFLLGIPECVILSGLLSGLRIQTHSDMLRNSG